MCVYAFSLLYSVYSASPSSEAEAASSLSLDESPSPFEDPTSKTVCVCRISFSVACSMSYHPLSNLQQQKCLRVTERRAEHSGLPIGCEDAATSFKGPLLCCCGSTCEQQCICRCCRVHLFPARTFCARRHRRIAVAVARGAYDTNESQCTVIRGDARTPFPFV